MSTSKTIHFLAGLPRSGSTLLAYFLAQNPKIHVTPTSGICDMLRAMLQAYFGRVERPICIDKNRYWAEFLEMGAKLWLRQSRRIYAAHAPDTQAR